jgi:hypothetical protein
VVHAQRLEDVLAQIPVKRLSRDLLHDLAERGEPVVAVGPSRPRLDIDG